MAQPISIEVTDEVKSGLEHLAQRFGTSPAALGASYLKQAVRMSNHPNIEFRNTPAGSIAHLRGVRLPVWLAIETIEDCGGNAVQAADLLHLPPIFMDAAMTYANAFASEIAKDRASTANDDELAALIPNYTVIKT